MMLSASNELTRIASSAIGPLLERSAGSDPELDSFLQNKNGCFAFESALHVFPYDDSRQAVDLKRINDPEAEWKSHYWHDFSQYSFFAADIFGGLFGLAEGAVIYFEPETGEVKHKAGSFDEWCKLILSKYRVETGWPLASAWQQKYGPIEEGNRLIPKIFFVFGGKFEVGNLYKENIYTSLSLRGDIARQIKDLPDGKKIRLQTE